ncbi:hypothetical protein E1263_19975 [Kribbella antibiotica]|uniref:Uncharacterized protein n=1 Tax=Kribbella antibiotica TaxID=190195 RepID=A0A4R4ZIL5_9ACTN|nr:hypothetical protein [Kribbella antibiotica]TDD58295.1 hypothetical protein E1263_19975 [Kribbella antibiotica]
MQDQLRTCPRSDAQHLFTVLVQGINGSLAFTEPDLQQNCTLLQQHSQPIGGMSLQQGANLPDR